MTAAAAIAPTAIGLANALRVGTATITAAQTSLDVLCCDTLQDCGAWPDTELEIVCGDWRYDLPVWAVASWVRGAHPTLRGGDWDVDVSDGQFRGFRLPTVAIDDETGWTVIVHGGDNLACGIALTAASEAEADEAAEVIGDALQDAYDTISVPEPDEKELVDYLSDLRPITTVYIDDDGEINSARSSVEGPYVDVRSAHILNRWVYSLTPSWTTPARAKWDGADAIEAARDLLLQWLETPTDPREVARLALQSWDDEQADETEITALFQAIHERDPDEDDEAVSLIHAARDQLSADEAKRVLSVLGDDCLTAVARRIRRQQIDALVPREDQS